MKLQKAMKIILEMNPVWEISIVSKLREGKPALYEVEIYEWSTTGDINSVSVVDSVKPTITEAVLDVLQKLQDKGKLQ